MTDSIMCKKHNYERKYLKSMYSMSREIKYYAPCPYCAKERQEEEEKEELKKLYDNLNLSNIGRKYYPLTFSNLKKISPSFEDAKKRAIKYCEVAQVCKEKGLGIYFFGDNGRGKTTLMACMIKELIKKGYKPYFTTLIELQENIFNKLITIEEVKNKDFLFIDDIGTESTTKNNDVSWIGEKLFEIVSHRDKELLPTIFSSNFKISELIDKGVMKKTAERISTLGTVKLEIVSEESFRNNKEIDIPF